jgi:spore maturation protein CgeB
MKVLLSGAWNPAFEAVPEYLVDALRVAGHRVSCFDHRRFHIPGRIRSRVPLLDRFDTRVLNRRLIRLARSFRPDLLLVIQGAQIAAETVRAIRRETGAVAVNWWMDYPAEFEEGLALARSGAYHRFFVSGTDARRRHRRAGAPGTDWLPFGCDPSCHRPLKPALPPEERNGCRIVFVGSAYPERRDVLAGLADLGLGIWGPGWERYRNDPRIGPCIRGGALRPSEWVRVFSAADVVLNISYGLGGDPESYGTMANVRVFETLACGACQVVDGKEDIRTLFRDGEHLAMFRNAVEVRDVVVSLLDDPERRKRLAEHGRREVLEKHTWSRRLNTIVNAAADCGVAS